MSMVMQLVLIIVGLFAVGWGVREARSQRRMRRFGVHSSGVVLRYALIDKGSEDEQESRPAVGIDLTGGSNPDRFDGVRRMPSYAPVVGFYDENGVRREFTSNLSSSIRKLAESSTVPVAHLSGRPETAQLDTLGYKMARLMLCFGTGAAFIAMAVLLGLR
jgi:hypothetical protein